MHLKLDAKYDKKAGFNFSIYIKNLLKTIRMVGLQSQFQNVFVNKKVKENVDKTHRWTSIHKLIFFCSWQKICLYIYNAIAYEKIFNDQAFFFLNDKAFFFLDIVPNNIYNTAFRQFENVKRRQWHTI